MSWKRGNDDESDDENFDEEELLGEDYDLDANYLDDEDHASLLDEDDEEHSQYDQSHQDYSQASQDYSQSQQYHTEPQPDPHYDQHEQLDQQQQTADSMDQEQNVLSDPTVNNALNAELMESDLGEQDGLLEEDSNHTSGPDIVRPGSSAMGTLDTEVNDEDYAEISDMNTPDPQEGKQRNNSGPRGGSRIPDAYNHTPVYNRMRPRQPRYQGPSHFDDRMADTRQYRFPGPAGPQPQQRPMPYQNVHGNVAMNRIRPNHQYQQAHTRMMNHGAQQQQYQQRVLEMLHREEQMKQRREQESMRYLNLQQQRSQGHIHRQPPPQNFNMQRPVRNINPLLQQPKQFSQFGGNSMVNRPDRPNKQVNFQMQPRHQHYGYRPSISNLMIDKPANPTINTRPPLLFGNKKQGENNPQSFNQSLPSLLDIPQQPLPVKRFSANQPITTTVADKRSDYHVHQRQAEQPVQKKPLLTDPVPATTVTATATSSQPRLDEPNIHFITEAQCMDNKNTNVSDNFMTRTELVQKSKVVTADDVAAEEGDGDNKNTLVSVQIDYDHGRNGIERKRRSVDDLGTEVPMKRVDSPDDYERQLALQAAQREKIRKEKELKRLRAAKAVQKAKAESQQVATAFVKPQPNTQSSGNRNSKHPLQDRKSRPLLPSPPLTAQDSYSSQTGSQQHNTNYSGGKQPNRPASRDRLSMPPHTQMQNRQRTTEMQQSSVQTPQAYNNERQQQHVPQNNQSQPSLQHMQQPKYQPSPQQFGPPGSHTQQPPHTQQLPHTQQPPKTQQAPHTQYQGQLSNIKPQLNQPPQNQLLLNHQSQHSQPQHSQPQHSQPQQYQPQQTQPQQNQQLQNPQLHNQSPHNQSPHNQTYQDQLYQGQTLLYPPQTQQQQYVQQASQHTMQIQTATGAPINRPGTTHTVTQPMLSMQQQPQYQQQQHQQQPPTQQQQQPTQVHQTQQLQQSQLPTQQPYGMSSQGQNTIMHQQPNSAAMQPNSVIIQAPAQQYQNVQMMPAAPQFLQQPGQQQHHVAMLQPPHADTTYLQLPSQQPQTQQIYAPPQQQAVQKTVHINPNYNPQASKKQTKPSVRRPQPARDTQPQQRVKSTSRAGSGTREARLHPLDVFYKVANGSADGLDIPDEDFYEEVYDDNTDDALEDEQRIAQAIQNPMSYDEDEEEEEEEDDDDEVSSPSPAKLSRKIKREVSVNSVPPSKPALRRKSTLNERFTQHDTDRQMRVVNRFVHSQRSAAGVAAPTQVVHASPQELATRRVLKRTVPAPAQRLVRQASATIPLEDSNTTAPRVRRAMNRAVPQAGGTLVGGRVVQTAAAGVISGRRSNSSQRSQASAAAAHPTNPKFVPGQAKFKGKMTCCKILNLDTNAPMSMMREMGEACGPVNKVGRIKTQPDVVVITFKDESHGVAFRRQYHNSEVMGRRIRVEFIAQKRPS